MNPLERYTNEYKFYNAINSSVEGVSIEDIDKLSKAVGEASGLAIKAYEETK